MEVRAGQCARRGQSHLMIDALLLLVIVILAGLAAAIGLILFLGGL